MGQFINMIPRPPHRTQHISNLSVPLSNFGVPSLFSTVRPVMKNKYSQTLGIKTSDMKTGPSQVSTRSFGINAQPFTRNAKTTTRPDFTRDRAIDATTKMKDSYANAVPHTRETGSDAHIMTDNTGKPNESNKLWKYSNAPENYSSDKTMLEKAKTIGGFTSVEDGQKPSTSKDHQDIPSSDSVSLSSVNSDSSLSSQTTMSSYHQDPDDKNAYEMKDLSTIGNRKIKDSSEQASKPPSSSKPPASRSMGPALVAQASMELGRGANALNQGFLIDKSSTRANQFLIKGGTHAGRHSEIAKNHDQGQNAKSNAYGTAGGVFGFVGAAAGIGIGHIVRSKQSSSDFNTGYSNFGRINPNVAGTNNSNYNNFVSSSNYGNT